MIERKGLAESIVEIPLEKLRKNSWNPQKMSPMKFNMLCEEIEKEGFDEPILVVPSKTEEGCYVIIAGEHRYEAMKVLGEKTIPAIVKDWTDEEEQKIKTVRRNLLRGELDEVKFSRLVNDLVDSFNVPINDLPELLGFETESEFSKYYIGDRRKKDEQIKKAIEDVKRETRLMDGMSFVLHNIFGRYGDTVPKGFIFFMNKGKMHLMVEETPELEKVVELLVGEVKKTDMDINDFFVRAIGRQLSEVSSKGE